MSEAARLVGLDGHPLAGDEVDQGMRYISEEIAAGRSGIFLGRGPAGFALIVGSPRAVQLGAGIGIGCSLTPAGLSLLHDRILGLLHGTDVVRKV